MTKLRLKRYRVDGHNDYSADKDGHWVRWEDVRDLFKDAQWQEIIEQGRRARNSQPSPQPPLADDTDT